MNHPYGNVPVAGALLSKLALAAFFVVLALIGLSSA